MTDASTQDTSTEDAGIVQDPLFATSPDERLRGPIRDARMLVAFLCRRGRCMEGDVIETVANADLLRTEEGWSPQGEQKFWLAYNHLAEAARPSTIDTIRAARVVTKEGLEQVHGSIAQRTVDRFRMLALATLLSVLAMQIFWFIGNGLMKNIDEERLAIVANLEERQEVLRDLKVLLWLQSAQDEISPELYRNLQELQARQQLLESRNADLESRLEASYAILPLTTLGLSGLVKEPSDNEVRRVTLLEETQHFLNATVLNYFLPLLLGLLGASVYVLRRLSYQLQHMTFQVSAGVRYLLRVYLGAIAGLTLAWLLPEGQEFLPAVSPLALAFIAGYSVEVVFEMLDRAIDNFVRGKQVDHSDPAPA